MCPVDAAGSIRTCGSTTSRSSLPRRSARTVTYVANIFKYYVTFRLVLEDMERQKKPQP
jgi:hypothetical protein